MTRECHVRFCERLRGQLLRPTHHFGMKGHIEVDSQSKVFQTVVVTPANTADCKVLDQLLHGQETRVYDAQAYKSQGRKAPKAKNFTNRQCKWKHYNNEAINAKNRAKSKIRARVRARLQGDQPGVRLREVALPRLGQERQPDVRDGAGQHFSRTPQVHGSSPSAVRNGPTGGRFLNEIDFKTAQIIKSEHCSPSGSRKLRSCADVP